MRLFVAVPLSSELDATLGELQKTAFSNTNIAWSKPGQLHITLKFLGKADEKQVPGLQEVLAFETQPLRPFSLSLKGVGVFPPRGVARTLWAGVEHGLPELQALADKVEAAVEPFGFVRESRPYSPHVTLGRLRGSQNMAILQAPLEQHQNTRFGSMAVTSFMLYDSQLSATGSVYRVLEAFDLKGD